MSKLEDEVQQFDTAKLQAMQAELREKVEQGKIGFGKRALNLFKAALIGAGVGEAVGAGYAVAKGRDYHVGLSAAFTNPFVFAAAMTQKSERVGLKESLKSNDPTEKHDAIFFVATTAIQLGAIITSALMLNKSSKHKQEEKLGFVEAELARREQKALSQQQGVPEVG